MESPSKPVLVVGGGIAGMTAAIEAAEAGCKTILIEKSPFLGGRVARFHLYFPKLCPPACGLEMNYSRIRRNPRITVLTCAELEKLSGSAGNFEATVRIAPRFVTRDCTLCGACVPACPAERPEPLAGRLGARAEQPLTATAANVDKAIYVAGGTAFPAAYAIDRTVCPVGCHACVDACSYKAIDLAQQPERRTFEVATVIAATGWEPYDVSRLDKLGFGKYVNVVTNVMLERMASADGPTGGHILRPSDGNPPSVVAFVQCAGSRDENHLPYCSAVCCSATLKQISYIRALYPDAEVAVFYMDIRTAGRHESFYSRVASDRKLRLIKGKVASIQECPGTRDLLVTAEDVLAGKKISMRAGLVVLAAGVVPRTEGLPPGFVLDEFHFAGDGRAKAGLYTAGCVRHPADVASAARDGAAAALKALHWVAGSGQSGSRQHG